MKKLLLILILSLHSVQLFAQEQIYTIEGNEYCYSKPGTLDFLLNSPQTYMNFGSEVIKSKYITSHLIIAATTALTIYYDQPMYDQFSEWGRKWGIGNNDNTKAFLSIGDFPLFRGPTDWGSAMYFIGDGWTHLGLSLGFLTAGLINEDNRALQTASQIAEGMVCVGSFTQLLKHITGRETPSRATQDAGVWRFFPDQIDYHKNVPKYDAFPSGHLATAMMTLTVIAKNYEEYNWIRPVGYGLMALLSYQMVNNGVHWVSDYPLALGIGYWFGKVIVENGRKKIFKVGTETKKLSYRLLPYLDFGNTYGFSLSINLK